VTQPVLCYSNQDKTQSDSVIVWLCCVCSEVGGRTQYRLLCKDAGGDTEQTMLHETVPTWVVDVTVQVFHQCHAFTVSLLEVHEIVNNTLKTFVHLEILF